MTSLTEIQLFPVTRCLCCAWCPWSRLHVIESYELTLYIIVIINGRESKCTTAIIITCKPILTHRSRLLIYKCLVSVSSRNLNVSSRALTSLAHHYSTRMMPVPLFYVHKWTILSPSDLLQTGHYKQSGSLEVHSMRWYQYGMLYFEKSTLTKCVLSAEHLGPRRQCNGSRYLLTDTTRKGRKRTWRQTAARTHLEEGREKAHIWRETTILP